MLQLQIVEGPAGANQPADSFMVGPNGATIGRTDACDWKLDDPDSLISRVHCHITFEGNEYRIRDNSTNGTFLNGSDEAIGRGNQVALQSGDQILLGEHVLSVVIHQQVAAPDLGAGPDLGFAPGQPMESDAKKSNTDMGFDNAAAPQAFADVVATPLGADLLGPSDAGRRSSQPAPGVSPHLGAGSAPSPLDIPVSRKHDGAGLLPPSPGNIIPDEGFDPQDLLKPATPAQPTPPTPSPAPSSGQGPANLIPDDWFSMEDGDLLGGSPTPSSTPSPPQSPARAPAPEPPRKPAAPDLPPVAAPPPTPVAPSPEPMGKPLIPDLGNLLDAEPAADPEPSPSPTDVPDPVAPVEPVIAEMPEKASPPLLSEEPMAALAEEKEILADDLATEPEHAPAPAPETEPEADPFAALAPEPVRSEPTLPDVMLTDDTIAEDPPPEGTPRAAPPPRSWASPGRQPQDGTSPDGLRSALRSVLGRDADSLSSDQLLALVEQLADIVAIVVPRTMGALQARTQFKETLRLRQTLIRARENNPLKISVGEEQALQRLLLNEEPGMLGGVQAIDQALRELAAHQSALIAALKPALRETMGSLSPESIEKKYSKSRADRLPLGNRKGKLWEEYSTLYRGLAESDGRGMEQKFLLYLAEYYEDALSSLED